MRPGPQEWPEEFFACEIQGLGSLSNTFYIADWTLSVDRDADAWPTQLQIMHYDVVAFMRVYNYHSQGLLLSHE